METATFDAGTGLLLSDQTQSLAAPGSLNLYDVGAALVRDTSAWGLTGPLVGNSVRVEASPTFGDLDFTTVTADYRRYLMPVRPLTIAARVLHLGRYGSDSEDERLTPLFLGYPTLVRGYDVDSFNGSECVPNAASTCPEFDRLIGSRMLVTNLELRAPLVGLFQGRLNYGPVPAELFAFYDGGMAWTSGHAPALANGLRQWVASTGAGVRVNVFGYAVAEFNLVHPLDRPQHHWAFVFNLRPGW